jgi:5-formyltetrahydrofolate cyclo-ligase
LGRGAGFFDRLFATLPADIVRVGLAYEFQEISDLPSDPWDVPVEFVITERRTVRCGAAAPALTRSAQEEMNCHESA